MTKKNILITGAAGFIASSFVEISLKKNYRVIALDAITYAGDLANLSQIDKKEDFQLIIGNITDKDLVTKLLIEHDIDIIVNFAAESHVDNSISSPEVFINTNIIGTFNLLNCCLNYYKALSKEKQERFRYVQISTDEVFGSLGSLGKFHEKYPYAPNSPYSASKASSDHLTRAWFETYSLPTIITNCSNNYGPRQHIEKLIPKIITNALNQQDIPIYGDGKNIRDWIHVSDHCHGVMLAIEQGIAGESYCFGGNEEKTNLEVANTICNILDELRPRTNGSKYSQLIKMVDDRLGHDLRYAIDDSNAREKLGFSREYNFTSGINQTISWYLDNQDWCSHIRNKK